MKHNIIAYYNIISYNMLNNKEVIDIIIIKSSRFKSDYKKLMKKHMEKEIQKLLRIEELIMESSTLNI